MGLGIRRFLAPEYIVGQYAFHRTADNAFLPAACRLYLPRNIESVTGNPVVAERHPDLKPMSHTHPVLAVKQALHKPIEVQHEHLTHTSVLAAVGVEIFGVLKRFVTAEVDVIIRVNVAQYPVTEQTRTGCGRASPRKSRFVENFLVVIPRIAAEDLICALTAESNGEVALDSLAEQVQRAVHVCHSGQVTGIGRQLQSVGQSGRIDLNIYVLRADER